jgi:hypothetical protein
VVVRADAAFALPTLYEALEQRGVRYAIRLPANDILERAIDDLLVRPGGQPSYAPLVRHRSFQYQAASWDQSRRPPRHPRAPRRSGRPRLAPARERPPSLRPQSQPARRVSSLHVRSEDWIQRHVEA